MNQNIYRQDPNEYIKSLSQVRKSIQKIVPSKPKFSSNIIDTSMDKNIADNDVRYKKTILVNQRVKLSKQNQYSIQEQKKIYLQELLASKIRISEEVRQQKKKKLVQTKKVQRLMKQTINFTKKQQIRKNNISRSLQIIQKMEKNSNIYSSLPIKLRLFEQQIKSSRMLNNHSELERLKTRINSQFTLPKLYNSMKLLAKKENFCESIEIQNSQNIKNQPFTHQRNKEESLNHKRN